ncbi:MAG TPA: extracellular solute-binding protein [Spirochaetia bacterium]|nr:extracellular solute-binding protein [Spirochaetia bacterium]
MKNVCLSLICCLFLFSAAFVFASGEKMAVSPEKGKLVMWDVQTTGVLPGIIDQTAQEFMKANPGIELEVVHIQNDPFKTKLKVAMGAGSPPDIFHNWGGGPLKEYIDSGMVATIDEAKSGLLKTYIPASFDPVTFDGKTYGSAYAGLTGVFFFYRKDLLAQYGLTPPKTQGEFFAMGEKLKANGVVPITLANKTKWTGSFFYMYMADRYGGGDMFLNALYRKPGGSFEAPGYINAGKALQDLVKRDFFPSGFNGMDEDTGQSRMLIYSKKAGVHLMGNWFVGQATKESPETMAQLDLFSFPSVEGGKGDPTNLIGSPGQNYYSIAVTCKNKPKALEFLTKFIMSPSYIQALAGAGYVPPVKGASTYISDPIMKKIALAFEAAGHVQVYYDQFLPPAMGELHKDLVQGLFGLTITPEEVARRHEKAIIEEMKK